MYLHMGGNKSECVLITNAWCRRISEDASGMRIALLVILAYLLRCHNET